MPADDGVELAEARLFGEVFAVCRELGAERALRLFLRLFLEGGGGEVFFGAALLAVAFCLFLRLRLLFAGSKDELFDAEGEIV